MGLKNADKKDPSKDNRKLTPIKFYLGLLWMINQLEENLDKFNASEMWKTGYYSWLLEFLDIEDSKKLFVWVEREEVMLTNANPPKFYGKLRQI